MHPKCKSGSAAREEFIEAAEVYPTVAPQSRQSDAAAEGTQGRAAAAQRSGGPDSRELRAVQELLRDWVRWNRRWTPHLGYPGQVPYLDRIRGAVNSYAEPDDYTERVDAYQLKALDRCIENLPPDLRMALRFVYFKETAPAIAGKAQAELVALCEHAELALIPALRKRNVLL